MSIRKSLAIKSVQVSITAAILFLIVANPMLFNIVDMAIGTILGTKYGTNHMIVLVLHAIVFGILMYFSSKYFFDDSYKWLEKNM
jgi:hypothetical protein|tara:strand:+ start:64 stop:318 length:255 start_codon:yes stop_codon:yes gene_type:complete